MKLSNYFLPIIKETPSEAQIVSHRLMLRAGMIKQMSAGIYNWLPLGFTVLNNIENIVRKNMNEAGAIELLMPTMQDAQLWQESGRGDYCGNETLKAIDRHEKTLFYGATNEEVITDIFRSTIRSYKELPKNLYHIQWKFRDEIRPRFGVMRGREFLMKDAYSFDVDEEGARKSYNDMYRAYIKTFKEMGLKAIPFKADTGEIGGDLSHEFCVIADTGENKVFYDRKFDELLEADKPDIDELQKLYAKADDMHDEATCPLSKEELVERRGIEVGHIFYLGDKYSKAMNATITSHEGKEIYPQMGCYGIGVSRLVGAIIEANHDDNGIIFPVSVAPFKVSLLNLKQGDETCDKVCEEIYFALQKNNISVLYDDTDERAGSKFATHDLIGSPYQIIVGPKGVKEGKVEFKNRRSGDREDLSVEEAIRHCEELNEV